MADIFYEQRAGFFDSVDLDRLYYADDMNIPYREIFTDGIAYDGVTESFLCTAQSGMIVHVAGGVALLDHHWIDAAPQSIQLEGNSSINDRYDAIFLRIDKSQSIRSGFLVYRTGGNSAPAAVNTSDIHEFKICNIHVPGFATDVIDNDIEDRRGTADCPFIEINLDTLGYVAGRGIRIDGNVISATGGGEGGPPSSIKICKLPDLLTYPESATDADIDLTGIAVGAYREDGSLWTDEDYPTGRIPISELNPHFSSSLMGLANFEHFQLISMEGISIRYANGINTISGTMNSGAREKILKEVSVEPNTNYTLSFNYSSSGFTEHNLPLNQHAAVCVAATRPPDDALPQDLNLLGIQILSPIAGSYEYTFSFNTGSLTSVYLWVDLAAVTDESSVVITIGDFYIPTSDGIMVEWESPSGDVLDDSYAINPGDVWTQIELPSASLPSENYYTESDEGKVLYNGVLVAQTSQNISQNGTYDTTLKNEVVVDVEGSGGIPIISRDLWDSLPISTKRSYGLIAIQDRLIGFDRGELVNGADFIVNVLQTGSAWSNTTFSCSSSGTFKLLVLALNSESSTKNLTLTVELNNVAVTGTTLDYHSYTSSGTNKRNYRLNEYEVQVEAGDEIEITLSDQGSYSAFAFALLDIEYLSLLQAITTADSAAQGAYISDGAVIYGTFDGQSHSATINADVYSAENVISTENPGSNYKSSYIFWFAI